GEHEGHPYLALEYMAGGNLARKLARQALPALEAARLTALMARAIQAAHESGVIHRDLKAGNILLTASGVPKVADFGLAKQLDDDLERTHTGHILGTAQYMAPEQATGQNAAV